MQDLQNLHKWGRRDVSAGMMLDCCGPGTEEQREENPWGLLASLVNELYLISENSCCKLNKVKWGCGEMDQ